MRKFAVNHESISNHTFYVYIISGLTGELQRELASCRLLFTNISFWLKLISNSVAWHLIEIYVANEMYNLYRSQLKSNQITPKSL